MTQNESAEKHLFSKDFVCRVLDLSALRGVLFQQSQNVRHLGTVPELLFEKKELITAIQQMLTNTVETHWLVILYDCSIGVPK
jgi:hypothetical protein